MPSKDAIGAPRTIHESIYELSKTNPIIACIFDVSMLGIAIFDRQHRFLAVNKTLAALHGLPAKDHIGKTLREVVPKSSAKTESLVDYAFSTGECVQTEEITAQVPTRNEVGHWTVSFIPIRDERGAVSEVCTIAAETTERVMLAECLRNVMNTLPQVRDRVSWAYLSSQRQALDPSLLSYAAENLEQCLRSIQKLSGLVETLGSVSGVDSEAESQQLSLLTSEQVFPSSNGHTPHAEAPSIALTPREVQVVTLLAQSKSNKEISGELSITVSTVETYRHRIMDKLQIHSMVELVRYAVRNKLIDP